MKKKFTTLLSMSTLLFGMGSTMAQENQAFPSVENICGTSKAMEELYRSNPQAKAEQDAREAFTQQYIKDNPNAGHSEKTTAAAKYRIPVVFHVYGGPTHTFWGKTVTKAIIDGALADMNKDFQGLQADYNLVNNAFASIKGPLDISFELALKKKDGTATDGIDWQTGTGAGYGNAIPGSASWDNKMYFNIYIVADLYNDGDQYNSGVCWYPNVGQTNAGTAGMVYNGQYLGSNTGAEFRSVLTHEAGHFLNLAHTFDTGCSGTGDGVTDTPLHSSTSLGCHASQTATTPKSDCGSWLVNVENFMDYNGANSCYRNFTKGQIARMEAALNANDVTRKPLWQTSNLIATGLLNNVGIDEVNINVSTISPNPSNGKFQVELNVSKQDAYTIEVSNMFGQIVHRKQLGNLSTGYYQTELDIEESAGVYFLSIVGSESKSVAKLIKQ